MKAEMFTQNTEAQPCYYFHPCDSLFWVLSSVSNSTCACRWNTWNSCNLDKCLQPLGTNFHLGGFKEKLLQQKEARISFAMDLFLACAVVQYQDMTDLHLFFLVWNWSHPLRHIPAQRKKPQNNKTNNSII